MQTVLDGKEAKGSAATALTEANTYTDTQISSAVGTINISITEVQSQVNTKASSDHSHKYAGSDTIGGAANSANKLNTDAGDSGTPVYFKDGIPVPCTSISVDAEGNSETASHLKTPRKIILSGDVSGEVSFDGSKDVTIDVVVADNSHSHTTSEISGLDTVLSGKANTDHSHTSEDISDLQSKLDAKVNTSDITVATDSAIQALFA